MGRTFFRSLMIVIAIAASSAGSVVLANDFSTIDGQFAGPGPVGFGFTRNLTVVGRGGVPSVGAGAVALNVTVANPKIAGFLTVWPAGQPRPLASNLNFVPGQSVPNMVIVPIGAAGQIAIFNSAGTTDVIVDVLGWFPTGASFTGLTPARLMDTRGPTGYSTIDGQFLGAGALGFGLERNLTIVGRGGVPLSGGGAVALNVTVANPTFAGFLTVWPAGEPRPLASNLNFVPGQSVPNMVIAPIGANGEISIFNSAGTTDVIVDVLGWFPGTESFTGLTPSRLMDTRGPEGYSTIDGQFLGAGALGFGLDRNLTVVGRGGVPTPGAASPAGAVALNVTVANPTFAGFLTVWPAGQPRPLASNLNFVPGQSVPNMVIVPLGADGKISIFNSAGATDVIVDVLGWFPASASFTGLTPARLMDTRGARPCTPSTPPTPPVDNTLKFDLSEACGLALASTISTTQAIASQAAGSVGAQAVVTSGSNLLSVGNTGQSRNAVVSGTASLSGFLIAPSDKLYVLFSSRTNLADTTQPGTCLLAEVDQTTGVPTCIEDQLDSVANGSKTTWAFNGEGNPAIQFDSFGAIYYLGRSGPNTVLRRYSGGIKTDLANDNITISDFVVLPSGNVIVDGQTNSTSAQWVRRISQTGGLKTLSDNNSSWMREFPDGNVYMGLFGSSNYGVRRYLADDDTLDPRFWIGSSAVSPYFAVTASLCAPVFCQGNGRDVKQIFETREGEEFAISSDGIHGSLMKYFPIVSKPATQVASVSLAESVPGILILAGLNSASQNVMTLYNLASDTETQLLGPTNEIEIYHLNYVGSTNTLLFDGLRFADNKYVIGQLDLNTNQVTSSQPSGGKLLDFQTF